MERFSTVLITALLTLVGLSANAQDDGQMAANESAAIGALKTIGTAQSLFREGDKDHNNVLDYAPNLTALAQTRLIDKVLGSGTKNGYRFEVIASPKHPEFRWMAIATPVSPGKTGERSFAVSHEGVVYHALKPFSTNAECKVTGVPVGGALKGWVKKRSKADGPFGSGIRAALEHERYPFARERGAFLGPKGELLMLSVGKRGEGFRFEVAHLTPKTSKVHVVEGRFDDQGRLDRIKILEGVFPRGRPQTILTGRRRKGKLRIEKGGKTEELTWVPNTITVHQALFVLPRLVGLPKTFSMTVAQAGVPLEGLLTIGVEGSGEDRIVSLGHPTLGEASITVKAGKIETLQTFDKKQWKSVTQQEARDALLANMPGKGLKALIEARRLGNEAAAIGGLKAISSAQMLFREGDKDSNNELDYAADLKALGKTQLIDSILASGTKQGYQFKVTRSKKNPEFLWMATAAPSVPGTTGKRYFAVSHEGVVYHALKPFTHNDACKITGVPVGQLLPGQKPNAKSTPTMPTDPSLGEARAIGACRTVGTAQSLFREGDKEGDGVLDYAANLKELADTQLISLASLKTSGYTFTLCHGKKAPEFTWMMVASPIKPGTTGKRHFATNHEGVTFYSDKPIELDRVECKIPQGLKPVGR